jgi:hypothetical protein
MWPSLADHTVFRGAPQKPEPGGEAGSRAFEPKGQLANTYLYSGEFEVPISFAVRSYSERQIRKPLLKSMLC